MTEELGLPTEGIYEDAKKILKVLLSPAYQPVRRLWLRRQNLTSFSPDITDHPEGVSRFVDYFQWHEDDSDWTEGNGLLVSATFGEILRLWTVPDYFVGYEARLIRFMRRGGETRRVFLLGPDLADRLRLWALQRTLMRHEILGFSPRVASVLDLRDSLHQLGMNCDMFAVLNRRIAYFVKFLGGDPPLLLRSVDDTLVGRAENQFQRIWHSADPFSAWYNRQSSKLPPDLLEQVELDVEAVRNVAAELK